MPNKESYFSERAAQSNSHWIPWVQQELLRSGVLAQAPEMPEPYEPDYEKWRSVFELFPIDEETILVGHSCGAGFLLRWLGEHKIKVGKVALVAPWMDPTGTRAPRMFGGITLDPSIQERTAGMAMFCSSDDGQEELDTFATIRSLFPSIEVKQFSDRGHFTFGDMKTEQFPELRDWLLK